MQARLRMALWSALIVLFILTRPAQGWGPEGHEVVGLLAEQRLTPSARAAVKDILSGGHLGDDEVANWADYIKKNKAYKRVYPNNDKWHYVDIDIATAHEDFELPADGDDVVDQVMRWQRELADPDVRKKSRRDALCFLVHFMADMHQPLHCAERDGDYGGNKELVSSFRGQYCYADRDTEKWRPCLHSTWDIYLVKEAMADGSVLDYAKALAGQATPEQLQAWSKGTPKEWAWEAHELAVTHAYRYTDGSPIPPPGTLLEFTSANYARANVPVVNEQLLKASVRLARFVNEALTLPRKAK